MRNKMSNSISIEQLYSLPVNTKVPIVACITDWDAKEVPGKNGQLIMRTRIRIYDLSGRIDAILWGTQPPELKKDVWITFMGKIQEAPLKPGYDTPYRSITIDKNTLEFLKTGAAYTQQQADRKAQAKSMVKNSNYVFDVWNTSNETSSYGVIKPETPVDPRGDVGVDFSPYVTKTWMIQALLKLVEELEKK
jgi:hypothetical protein